MEGHNMNVEGTEAQKWMMGLTLNPVIPDGFDQTVIWICGDEKYGGPLSVLSSACSHC
jgi:hypothetical protein